MTIAIVGQILKQSFKEWSEDRAMRLAAALACYTIISLAPLTVISLRIIAWILGPERAEAVVREQMTQLIGGGGAQAIGQMIQSAAQPGEGLLATFFSLAILLWSASYVFAELQDSLNTIWEVKPRPDMGWWETIRKRLLSMGMVFGIIFLLLVSMIVTAVLGAVVQWVVSAMGGQGGWIAVAFSYVLDFLVTTAVVWGAFTLIYKYLPDVRIGWSDVWRGALVTAVLFKLGQYALAIYFNFGAPTSAYGMAGSLVAVLLWAYYSASIVFFGAEVTQVYARRMGRGPIVPDEDAVKLTEDDRIQRGIPHEQEMETAAGATATLADRRGAPYPGRAPATVREPRVVTITRPTVESEKAYAVAGLGLVAGFVVGAIGLLTGRKYTAGGLEQINLNDRLDRLEAKYGRGKQLERHALELDVKERLDALDARMRHAADAVKRRTRSSTYKYHRPRWLQRLDEMVNKS